MKLFLKTDSLFLAKKILEEKLNLFNVKYNLINTNEVLFLESIDADTYNKLTSILSEYGFEIIENQKILLFKKLRKQLLK